MELSDKKEFHHGVLLTVGQLGFHGGKNEGKNSVFLRGYLFFQDNPDYCVKFRAARLPSHKK